MERSVPAAESVAAVAPPPDTSTGFMGDFLRLSWRLQKHEVWEGDELLLPVTCDGYVAMPVILQKDCGGHGSRFRHPTTLFLLPTGSETARGRRVFVGGLSRGGDNCLSFSIPALGWDGGEESVSLAQDVLFDTRDESICINLIVCAVGDGIEDHVIRHYFRKEKISGVQSFFFDSQWHAHQTKFATDGVLFADAVVPTELVAKLQAEVSALATAEPVDYQPGSKNCVRNLVDPSMYCYVRGESVVNDVPSATRKALFRVPLVESTSAMDLCTDMWGREIDDSRYQWLPSLFHVDGHGRTSIQGYINNLSREKYGGLYASLERLFEAFLPRFENMYAHLKALKFAPEGEELYEDLVGINMNYNPDVGSSRLRDMNILVITKIVDYELKSENDSIEGAWHVEGSSGEHIIMTGLYILDQDEDFEGGEILFKRAFLDYEASKSIEVVSNSGHWNANKVVEAGLVPVGKLPTRIGRMIVFPNYQINRLAKVVRCHLSGPTTTASKRRIIVFWVVNPERPTLSTADVPPQQRTMPREVAIRHRLNLMEEREAATVAFMNRDRMLI